MSKGGTLLLYKEGELVDFISVEDRSAYPQLSMYKRTLIQIKGSHPYVVDLFEPNEVTLCSKETDGSVSVHRLSESESVRKQMKIFTLGEIWTSEGDDQLATQDNDHEHEQP